VCGFRCSTTSPGYGPAQACSRIAATATWRHQLPPGACRAVCPWRGRVQTQFVASSSSTALSKLKHERVWLSAQDGLLLAPDEQSKNPIRVHGSHVLTLARHALISRVTPARFLPLPFGFYFFPICTPAPHLPSSCPCDRPLQAAHHIITIAQHIDIYRFYSLLGIYPSPLSYMTYPTLHIPHPSSIAQVPPNPL
jgi:hypothetical protein